MTVSALSADIRLGPRVGPEHQPVRAARTEHHFAAAARTLGRRLPTAAAHRGHVAHQELPGRWRLESLAYGS